MNWIKQQISNFYWKHIGNLTVFGRFNGVAVVIVYKRGIMYKRFISKGGYIENVHVTSYAMPDEEFEKVIAIYQGDHD